MEWIKTELVKKDGSMSTDDIYYKNNRTNTIH